MKVVIIGGVAGGATAAARLRRLDEKAEIVVFEKTGFVSYANCGLPYYVGGVIEDEKELTLQTPESFKLRFNIDVRVRCEVLKIDAVRKYVLVKNLTTDKKWEESYDKLILSPGAKPVKPNLPGIDSEKIYFLRTVEDTFKLYDTVYEKFPKSATVIGGGYIGIEVAENLREKGINVTIIQRPKQLMNTLDFDMATFVHSNIRAHGINLKLGSSVVGFREEGFAIKTLLKDEEEITSDIVIMAVGVTPDSHLAKEAGLKLGLKDSIIVNYKMQTSDPDIYAVGDAVQIKHGVSENDALIALAGPANKQGRIAADNIFGIESKYQGSFGSSIIKIFDQTVAGTGLTEKAAEAAGLDFDSVVLSPNSHAGYYPGAKVMTMKVVYEKRTLRLLGAQIVGSEGVDKRIDVLATAIQAGIKADKLKDLDLSYAPPFSSAKDPVNMAGFMIENISKGLVKQFKWDEVASLPRDGSVNLLDTRTPAEYARGHVEGFMNIPVDDLRDRISEINPSKPTYVFCQSGLRSYIACRILSAQGIDCYNFSGGYRFYESVMNERKMRDASFDCGVEKE